MTIHWGDPAVYNTIAAIALGGGAVVWIGRVLHALDRKVDRFEHAQIRMEDKLQSVSDDVQKVEQQFGPNGGGLREAVNNIASQVTVMDKRLNRLVSEVATVAGRFDQHVIEGGRK